MANPFDADKREVILGVLDYLGTRYRRERHGWQPIRCVAPSRHAKGDKTPSGSVNLDNGYYTCHSCGLKGDGFALMMELHGKKAQEVLDLIGQEVKAGPIEWLI